MEKGMAFFPSRPGLKSRRIRGTGKREEKRGKSGGGLRAKDRIVMSESKLMKKDKISRIFRKTDDFG